MAATATGSPKISAQAEKLLFELTIIESLGLSLTYEPAKQKVLVEADLGGVRTVRVGGATRTTSTRLILRGELKLGA